MTGGIGVAGKETIATSIVSVDEKPPVPVLLWIPAEGTDKFPTPIAGFVGNGYAVVSIEVESNFTSLVNLVQVIKYLEENAEKFGLYTEKIGIIQPSVNGYIAEIGRASC